ncbi:unnamed protein product [Spodoptera littoralis]|uniref:Uncharacterized protein n=1 Tax=Spodoptera littoralis TaxID=7109 RepID=A0A9P0IBJ5_SPOLI|nr:unnamed protein product [Spodoptera littoralis]CAH1643898.1 unnamed protein product [Spodoptera littoralis]
MQSLSPIGLKLAKYHTNFHPLFYPLGGGNYQNPFTADAYVITSICMPNFNPILSSGLGCTLIDHYVSQSVSQSPLNFIYIKIYNYSNANFDFIFT